MRGRFGGWTVGVVLLALVFFVAFPTVAAMKGEIVGKVTDAKTGEPLVSVNVVVAGTPYGAASDAEGNFRIVGVPPGSYELWVTMIGYQPAKLSVTVQAGQRTSIDVALRPTFLELGQLVVTATRTKRLLEDVPVVTEVVTAREIVDKGANDLAEALEDRPGIVIDASSSGGKILRMNGIDNKRILVLVDGVPVSGKVGDRQELNLFDADEIDHVEIVKGPTSALYGSEAMGGVVNVITRGISQDFTLGLRTRTGEYGLRNGNVYLSGTTRGLGYALSLDHTRQGAIKMSSEIDMKEFRNSNGSLRLQRKWVSGFLEGKLGYRKTDQKATLQMHGGENDTDTDVRHWDASLRFSQGFGPRASLDLTAYGSTNFRQYTSAPVARPHAASTDTTDDDLYGFRSDFQWRPHARVTVDVGYDMSVNRYESERVAEKVTRWQHGAFGQVQLLPINQLTLSLGARYDKITDLKGYLSPRFSAMLTLSDQLKFRGGWGKGFRAPSFIEMYSHFLIPIPGMPVYVIGNEDLKPEVSTGFHIGVEYFWRYAVLFNLTYYENRFKDLIADYWQRFGSTLSYRNIDTARFQTLEWQSKIFLKSNAWVTLAYNYTKVSEDEEYPTLGISPHMATLRANWAVLQDVLNLSVRYQYFSSTDVTQYARNEQGLLVPVTVHRDSYGLLDATATIHLRRMVTLRVGVNNITDYTDPVFGPYLGRRLFVDLGLNL